MDISCGMFGWVRLQRTRTSHLPRSSLAPLFDLHAVSRRGGRRQSV